MKRKILGGIMAIMAVAAVLVLTKSESKAEAGIFDGGKWVAEFVGQATPVRCKCVSSIWHNKCVVGDTTSDLSKCE